MLLHVIYYKQFIETHAHTHTHADEEFKCLSGFLSSALHDCERANIHLLNASPCYETNKEEKTNERTRK